MHQNKDFDTMTKMRICFALGASIDSKFLEELQKNATVTIDSLMRIMKYTANDGNLKLNGEPLHWALKRAQNEGEGEVTSSSSESSSSSEEEDSESEMDFKESVSISGWPRLIESKLKLMKFVAEKTKGISRPLSLAYLATEYVRKGKTEKSKSSIRHSLRRLRDEVYKMLNFDVATRVRIIFGLSARVDEGFLNELRSDAIVEVDEKRRISKYESNDGSLKLLGEHVKLNSYPMKEDVAQENRIRIVDGKRELMTFIAEQSRNTKSQMNINELSREFMKKFNYFSTIYAVQQQIHRFRTNLPKLCGFDLSLKIRMIFGLGVKIDQNYLERLRRNAEVEVDEKGRITKYKANDGSLELRGAHRRTYKWEDEKDEKKMKLKVKEDGVKPFDEKLFIENYKNEHKIKLEHPQLATSSSTRLPPITYGALLKTVQKSTRCGNGIEFLSILSDVAFNLKSPIMLPFVENVAKRIQESEIKKMYIPESILRSSFDVGLRVILDHSKLTVSNEESNISLKEVLMVFRVALFNSNGYVDFKDELRRMSYSNWKADLRVSYKNVRYGLEMAIEMAFP
ncbi:hypothetical protein GCK72_012062 [Caenorhabditis remanei]|uniref:SPK domain-containing protein n=1 Tax=Caenorhabditis remanei TaxID=31234 RepID=A0A6A5GM83_CAERE|nr:hypothetical protein GCK72_012062 [Caenorhabditis remanei]KAF1755612.1 hypothetical protein GCK72_012062 [Caenorhabditis remanei]